MALLASPEALAQGGDSAASARDFRQAPCGSARPGPPRVQERDRLAVAERSRVDGSWTVFSGDQIGTMLGHWLYTQIGRESSKVRRLSVFCILFHRFLRWFDRFYLLILR